MKSSLLAAVLLSVLGGEAAAQSPYRYDDDISSYLRDPETRDSLYGRLKYLPFDPGDADRYLSLGLDERERVEAVSNAVLGFRDRGGNLYDLHRLLVDADLALAPVRFFVQLGNHVEFGRTPGPLPTDIDRGDLQQGFADAKVEAGNGSAFVRAGRFLMAFDDGALIALRDGPNVRQSWDGIRAGYSDPVYALDLFAVRPVAVKASYFDDGDLAGQTLRGVHLETRLLEDVRISAFYYDAKMPKVIFTSKAGEERTHTLGVRTAITLEGWNGSLGAMAQTGRFASQDVLAWSAHADLGYRFGALPWTPQLSAGADVMSGGRDTGGTVRSFNPLFPNYSFSTEATIESPINLIQPSITATLRPRNNLTLDYKIEGLWRYSPHDSFYAAPGIPLVRPDKSDRRWTGLEQQFSWSWRIDDHFSVKQALAHFSPGAFLASGHARGEDFAMTELMLRL